MKENAYDSERNWTLDIYPFSYIAFSVGYGKVVIARLNKRSL